MSEEARRIQQDAVQKINNRMEVHYNRVSFFQLACRMFLHCIFVVLTEAASLTFDWLNFQIAARNLKLDIAGLRTKRCG